MGDIKNLQDFYETVAKAGVRLTHQFQMQFVGGNVSGLNDITVWASGSQLPTFIQNQVKLPYHGYNFNIPTGFSMGDAINFQVRENAMDELRGAFLFWSNTHSSMDILAGATGGGKKNFSTTKCFLHLLDEKMENIVTTYELLGTYPGEVGGYELTNADPEVASFPVVLNYQFWRIASAHGLGAGPFRGNTI